MAARGRVVAVRSVHILAPAKLNLGLAILGKRPDGYHEIDTIMTMIDLADELTVTLTAQPGITIAGMDDVPLESNLVTRALRGWSEVTGQDIGVHVDITKNIPSPAGLGGGSSNGATTIRALEALFPGALDAKGMRTLAASLGADCPFFLGSATARATGIGIDLKPLEPIDISGVIVVPPAGISAKTATLYGSLLPGDYGASVAIDSAQNSLEDGLIPALPNSFTRAAKKAFPAMDRAWSVLEDLTGGCSLSGAGPAIFTLTNDRAQAEDWADQLRDMLDDSHAVHAFTTLTQSPIVEIFS